MQELSQFSAHYPHKTYKKGEIILHAGQTPSSVFFIEKGFVKFYGLNDDGDEQLVGIDKAGETFPIGWIVGKQSNAFFYHEALTNCTLLLIPRQDYLEFLQKYPTQLYAQHIALIGRYMDLSGRINSLLQSGAKIKLLYCLRYVAGRFGKPYPLSPRKVYVDDFAITHQMLANMIGLSRETISIEMKKLTRDGYVSRRLHRLVIDIEKISERLNGS